MILPSPSAPAALFAAFLLTPVFAACGSGSDPDGDDLDGDGVSAEQCTVAEDCSTVWWCECEEGPPVNTRRCDNGRCAAATEICASSCESFGTTWTGNWGANPSSSGDGDGDGDGDGSSNGDGDGDGDASAGSCDSWFSTNACGNCGYDNCCAEGAACSANASCHEIPACIVSCVNQGASRTYCTSECKAFYASGASLWDAYQGCMDSACWSECP